MAAVAAILQAIIARVIIKRKLRSEFPIFFSYSCFGVLMVVVAIAGYMFSSCTQYYYIYWILSFIYMALEFGIMYEIFVNALKPYSALIDLGKMLFRWAVLFLLFAAILTGLATNGNQASKIEASVALLERSMRLMECGLLLLFFLFERKLGLTWRNRNITIALGMGAAAAMDLAVSYLKVHYAAWTNGLGIVNTLFYLGVLCFWVASFALPEPARKNVLDSPSRLIFQRWNEVLVSARFSASPAGSISGLDSFLPNVEQTVDRVLARKMVE